MGLWIDFARLEGRLSSVLHAPPTGGLSEHQLIAVGCLPAAGLTMQAFAVALGIGAPAATAVADRIVRAGAAQRRRDPGNRRIVRIVATRSGLAAAREYRETRLLALSGLLGEASPDQISRLNTAMETLTAAMGDSPSAPSLELMIMDPTQTD